MYTILNKILNIIPYKIQKKLYLPKIRCPNRLINVDTTPGKRILIALNNPSGNLANSESLTAITVVPRGVLVTTST